MVNITQGNEPPEEAAARRAEWESGINDRAFVALRLERDKRLHDCDWWASSDLSITDAQTAYRQALRDLPATADPANIIWPTEPSKED